MAIDNSFLEKQLLAKMQKIQSLEKMYVVYCAYTGKPFVICDPDTYQDEVWLFEDEKQLQEFAKPYLAKKVLLRGVVYENKDFLRFFSSLFTMGVNGLAFAEETTTTKIELAKLVKEPDYEQIPPAKRPLLNPNLQLTGMYFMQEGARPVPQEEKEGLKELEEEFSANLTKSRVLLCLELNEGPEDDMTKFRENKYRIPILKDKSENIYQPIFSDTLEFQAFAKERKLSAIAIPFSNLSKVLTKEAKGYMLNPNGYHMLLPKELLEGLAKRFPQENAK